MDKIMKRIKYTSNWMRAGIFAEWDWIWVQSHLRSIICIFKMAAGVKCYTVARGAEKAQLSLVKVLIPP